MRNHFWRPILILIMLSLLGSSHSATAKTGVSASNDILLEQIPGYNEFLSLENANYELQKETDKNHLELHRLMDIARNPPNPAALEAVQTVRPWSLDMKAAYRSLEHIKDVTLQAIKLTPQQSNPAQAAFLVACLNSVQGAMNANIAARIDNQKQTMASLNELLGIK